MRVPLTNRHVRPLAKRRGNLRKTGVAVDDLSTEKVQLRARGHKQVEQIDITHGRIVARFPVQIIGAEDPVDLRAGLGLDLTLLRDLVVTVDDIGIVEGLPAVVQAITFNAIVFTYGREQNE